MEFNFKKRYKIELAPTLDKHWYDVWELGKKEKYLGCFPSVTTVLNAYPFSEQLVKWIADKGYSEAREYRDEAGKSGTKIHAAIESLLGGRQMYRTEYKLEEWNKIYSFVKWYEEYKPEIIKLELPVFSKKLGVPGRVDCIARINGEIYVVDWKSSRSIHNSYYLQMAAYSNAIEEMTSLKVNNTAILQMGASNKNGYRFVVEPDWKDNLEVFKSVYKTWIYDNKKEGATKVEPPVLRLPETIKLNLKNMSEELQGQVGAVEEKVEAAPEVAPEGSAEEVAATGEVAAE